MAVEKLDLPAPGAAVWRRTKPILDELAARWPEIPNLLSFGGGTMLAARWRHRESADIDILAARGSGLRRSLEGRQANWFIVACEAAGGLQIEYLPATATITVSFPEGQWDLSELDPPLPGMEALAEVDGTPIQVLSNSQILAGKLLHRAFEAVPRDLFDLAVAATLDRPALDQAMAACPPGDVEALIHELRCMARAYRRQAPSAIKVTDPQWTPMLREAPDIVAAALESVSSDGNP